MWLSGEENSNRLSLTLTIWKLSETRNDDIGLLGQSKLQFKASSEEQVLSTRDLTNDGSKFPAGPETLIAHGES